MPALRTLRYTAIILLVSLSLSLHAQNNPFKMNDQVYRSYQKALKVIRDKKSLVYADSMYSDALRLGDKKGLCISRVVVMRHYSTRSSWADLHNAASEVRRSAQETGYRQYYYYSYHIESTWLINHNMSLKAWHIIGQMKKEAYAENNNYGISLSLRGLAHIYASRHSYQLSIKHYLEAAEFVEANVPDQSPSMLYTTLAKCYFMKLGGAPETALGYLDKALQTSQEPSTSRNALETKAFILYVADRVKEADEVMPDLKKYYSQIGVGSMYHNLMSMRSFVHGDIPQAIAYSDSLPLLDGYHRKMYIYERIARHDEALKIYRKISRYNDSIVASLHSSDIAEFEAQYRLDHLKHQNMRLDLQNSTLLAQHLKQQLAMEQMNASNRLLEAEVHKSEAERLELEARRLQSDAKVEKMANERRLLLHKRQTELLKQQKKEEQLRNQRMMAWVVLLLVVVVLLVYGMYRNRKQVAFLSSLNAELDAARKKAEEADKIKTLFIQNMSHEIRTPLNVIVGFSQLLSEPEIPMEDEEKREMGRQILEQSEMLTTLLNDILNVAELEAGTYIMNIAEVACNDTCRKALSMVQHRCPPSVRMYFTTDLSDAVTVQSDVVRMKQVLVNFLTNATKFTEHGEIRLHCTDREHPGYVTMSVTDTGRGVPPEHAEEIFERFKKLDQFKQGNGIGLNLCRLISQQLKGMVMLDTKYTGGARFLFLLPYSKAEGNGKA